MCEAPWIVARHHPLFYVTISGRIMSCSSCSRMWQCHTYSFPPVRGLGGTVNGTAGRSNLMMIRVTVPGNIITVSFHPISFASAGTAGPVKLTPPLRVAEAVHLEWLPVDELHVHQVEVYRVNIGCHVVDFPDLGGTSLDHLGRRRLRRRDRNRRWAIQEG